MQTVTQQLASYSRVSDQKFDALKQIMQHQRVNSDMLTQSIRNNQLALIALLNSLLPAEVQLMNLKTSLMLLRHHHISTDLIPWEHAERIWQEIRSHVQQSKNYFLVHSEFQSLYEDTENYFFRIREQLHIGLKIKISNFQQPLQLFKIEKIPLPISGSKGQNHQSILGNIPAYIAINDFDSTYFTFQSKPILQDDRYYNPSTEQHQTADKSIPTCALELFRDNISNAVKLCDTLLQPNLQPSAIKYMGDNLALLQNIDNYSITDYYGNIQSQPANCSICLKTVPCASKIQSGQHIIFTPDCVNTDRNDSANSTYYIPNLHIIAPLLNDELLKQLSAQFTLQMSPNFSLPTIDVQDEIKIKNAYKILDLKTDNLEIVINHTLSGGLIFTKPEEHIIHGLQHQGWSFSLPQVNWNTISEWFSSPFNITLKVIVFFESLAIAFLFYRVSKLAGMINAMQTVPRALAKIDQAETIKAIEEYLQTRNNKNTAGETNLIYSPRLSEEWHFMDVMVFFTLLFLSYTFYGVLLSISNVKITCKFIWM
jgi:hypothetical protein